MVRPVLALLSRFGPWVMLAACLFLLGILLTVLGAVFGFGLADVDAWLDAHGGVFHAAGKLLLRLFFGFWLLISLFVILSPVVSIRSKERPRWGCALLAIPAAWFCWLGAFGDY